MKEDTRITKMNDDLNFREWLELDEGRVGDFFKKTLPAALGIGAGVLGTSMWPQPYEWQPEDIEKVADVAYERGDERVGHPLEKIDREVSKRTGKKTNLASTPPSASLNITKLYPASRPNP